MFSSIYYIFFFLGICLNLLIFHIVVIAYFTLFERKILGSMQKRKGPDFAGFEGLLQPLADGLKLLFKETVVPKIASQSKFTFAACFVFFLSILPLVLIPFSSEGAILSPLLSIFLFLVFSTLGLFGIFLAGWLSNNNLALLGSIRAVSQMISYEIILSLCILLIIFFSQSSNFFLIISSQTLVWNIFKLLPIAFIFFIAMLAETNRAPFDLPEAESELVAGYNVEYSSMSFALFFLGEYSNIINISYLFIIFFLGGSSPYFLKFLIGGFFFESIMFTLKALSVFFIFVWVRATLPRFRFDQLILVSWRYFLPLTTALFFSFIFLI